MAQTDFKKCPACLHTKHSNIGEKNDFILESCDNCRTIFAKVSFENSKTNENVKELYDHYYDVAKFELHPAAEISLQNIVNSFETFRETKKILDIGFGEGGLLSVAEKNNWNCYGTELSPHSLKYGKERGWIVSNDVFTDERFVPNSFDVVTMIELIEHVPNPDFFLNTAFKMLRPGGILFLTTPNIRSINKRFLGVGWSVISPPEHIVIWSPNGINKALKRNNFVSEKIKTEGFNPIEILGRLKSNKEKENVSRNEAGFALNETFTSSPWRRAVKSSINYGLSVFRLGDGIKVWAIKQN